MPTFQNDPSSMLWDATAVSNAFLCEFMPAAPEGYVKVYLYGLMLAHGGAATEEPMLDDAAKALQMGRSEVEQALRYWERCRLVARVGDSPVCYRFVSVQQAMMMRQSAPKDDGYERFALALYDMFGDKRKLHGGETVLAYEWVEQMKLPPDVVFMLIRHMISTRGVQFSFKEAQKVVGELLEQQATTMETAEALFSRSEAAWKGARRLLNRLGKRRNPSMDEIDLYVKWTGEWRFAPKAIDAACAEMTKGDPSFGYLDRILQGIKERSGGGALGEKQVQAQLAAEKDEGAKVRAMLAAFGARAAVVDENTRRLYRDMRALADEGVILLAAREVGKLRGDGHSLDKVSELLSAWRDKGLTTEEQVSAYLKSVRETDKRLRALFALAGRDAGCTQQNRELLRKWREDWRLPDPLTELAAAYAKNTDKPMLYMDKLLGGWRDKDIFTVAEAEKEHERFQAATQGDKAKPGGVKKVIEQQYSQRSYDPEEVNGMSAEDIEEARKL